MRAWFSRAASALAFFVVLSTGAIAPSLASAQDPAGATREDPAESRATEFRAVRGPEAERVPGGTLLLSAYGVAWVLILLFVVRMGRIGTSLARDVERLERTLSATEPEGERRS